MSTTFNSTIKAIGLILFLISNQFYIAQEITITGKVLDLSNNEPIPYASVTLLKDSTLITGGTTNNQGDFKVLTSAKEFVVEISFIGYQTKTITEFTYNNGKVELDSIYLSEDDLNLDELEVTAEKSTTEFKLDKRVFNVGQDLSSAGSSALDVLNHVPSVNVSIEGDISLRGSAGVQILINGKPSVIGESSNTLGTITADMIERIEVITNPSAKYEAEGTAGIINIILKKEERKGLNGSVSVNTGYPNNHSIGLSLNRRTEKFNLFSQLGAGYRSLPRYGKTYNTDLINNTTVSSTGIEYRNEQFYNLILGTDYHINKLNVLTLSGNLALEVEQQPSEYDFEYIDSTGEVISKWNRTEQTSALNPKYQYELQYKKDFKRDKKQQLLFSALGNFFGKDQSSEFENTVTYGSDENSTQKTRTNFQEAKYTFKLDYTHPFSKKFTLESGAQYVFQDVSNDYAVQNQVNDVWVDDPEYTNIFTYNQNVLGVYTTGSYEHKRMGVKLGLRAENTDLKTLLVNTNSSNNRNYTNLFPTLHTSYKVTEEFSVQAGYSKRIYRPRLWDLNPFFNIRNSYSIRTGNPNLLPEFTDSYELSAIYILKKISMNASLFQRNTNGVIERVSFFDNNVSTYKPVNLGTKNSTGIEFNTKYEISKKITLNGDFNYSYFIRNGEFNGTSFDFNSYSWFTRWTAKFKLPKDFAIEVTGNYESGYKTLQGKVIDQTYGDFGIRKKILKGKAILNLGVRDIFASRMRRTYTYQSNFEAYSWGKRGRFITLNFSYGFGKGEAMQFTGARRH